MNNESGEKQMTSHAKYKKTIKADRKTGRQFKQPTDIESGS